MTDVQSMAPRRDSEQQERAEHFAGRLQSVDKRAVGLALATGAFALTARPARAQEAPSVTDILNFALTLEYLERNYYQMGLDNGVIPSGEATGKYQEIRDHEAAHVTLLQTAIEAAGETPVEEPTFDFTADGMFDPFNNYGEYLLLSQGFEDTGVRAYKGGAPSIPGDLVVADLNVLTVALQIHSVEARHASVVRRLVDDFGELDVDQAGWIAGAESPIDALNAVYEGEDDTTVAGIDVQGVPTDPDGNAYSDELVTEAYDEPLGMDAVLGIAGLFIVDDEGDDS